MTEPLVQIEDRGRVRILTLNRPDALNSFNEALYEASINAIDDAASAAGIAVLVITGNGRGFSSGADLVEMAGRNTGAVSGPSNFPAFADRLTTFPKPLICAVNGMAIGIGATMLAFADLVFMSTAARVRCPFTRLGLMPEAASSFTFPWIMGRQNAAWALMSSEWLSAEECVQMGLAFKATEPDQLMAVTMQHAEILANKPISSLIESKQAIVAPYLEQFAAARARENAGFGRLMGTPANVEALTAFAEKREPDFGSVND